MIQRTNTYLPLLSVLLAGFFLAACGKTNQDSAPLVIGKTLQSNASQATAAVTVTAEEQSPVLTTVDPTKPPPNIADSSTSVLAPAPIATIQPGGSFDDEEAARIMTALIGSDQDASQAALDSILETRDTRFVAVLIELIRGRQIGLVGGNFSDYVTTLEDLSDQPFGGDWPAWVEWYGKTELAPPPGFTSWKGLLLSQIDPGFSDFLQDEHPSRIRVEEIQWGGVPIDGIPPLESAPTLPGTEADYLLDEEPVFGVFVNGDARAYPLRIIDNHEMANDVIGGVPVSLAYCTLCGAAIAYDGRASDGNNYDFGTSGFLYRSNKLMYDRQTRTLWNQLTGEPVLGELAGEDVHLDILPVVLTSWSEWLEQHPETLVLDLDTGYYHRDTYIPGIFYGDYFAASDTMFPVWQRSGLLPPKEFVYTLHLNGEPKAYQIEALANKGVLNDTLGGVPIVLVANRGAVAVNGWHRFLGDVVYDAGGEVRVFERGDETFIPSDDPDILIDSEEKQWQVTEDGLVGPDGQVAERVNGHLAYWFGWYAFFPNTQLYSTSSTP